MYLCADLGIPVLGRKGASLHLRQLVAAFGRAGHSVVVAAPVLTKSPWEKAAAIDAPLLHVPPSATAESVLLALKAFNEMLGVERSLRGELRRIAYNEEIVTQIKRRFEAEPPDFVYERASLYTTAGVTLARELNVPVLVELNAPLAFEQSAYRATGLGELSARAERWTLSHADAVLAISDPLRDYVLSLGIESDRVHVIPNGVDPNVFQPRPPDPAIRARWGLGDGPVLGFVGGLRPWHGVDALPGLLSRLVSRYSSLRLLVAGDGPQRGDLERALDQRGLMRDVVFTGSLPHEEIAGLIRQFDVALAPYPRLDHPFYFSPLKLFEYMACGVPVVAASVGQIAEVVRDGDNGLLYPPGDADALLAACDRLLADPAMRRRLGQRAAADVRQYTWDRNAARVIEVARSVARAPGSGR